MNPLPGMNYGFHLNIKLLAATKWVWHANLSYGKALILKNMHRTMVFFLVFRTPPLQCVDPSQYKKTFFQDKTDVRPSYLNNGYTVYPKKFAHGFCFAVLCCGYTLTDCPISIRLTSLALWQSNDCPNASKATLMNMDKYFMWNHYERLHNHKKAKHNKTVCIFLGIYCTLVRRIFHMETCP